MCALLFWSLLPYFFCFALSLISKLIFSFCTRIGAKTDYYSAKKHTFCGESPLSPTICLPYSARHRIDFNVRQTFGSGVTQLESRTMPNSTAEQHCLFRASGRAQVCRLHSISLIIMCVRVVSLLINTLFEKLCANALCSAFKHFSTQSLLRAFIETLKLYSLSRHYCRRVLRALRPLRAIRSDQKLKSWTQIALYLCLCKKRRAICDQWAEDTSF